MKIALVRLRIPGSTVAGVGASNGSFCSSTPSSARPCSRRPGRSDSCLPCRGSSPLTAVGAGVALALVAVVVAAVPRLRANLRQGAAILATPASTSAASFPYQAGAWACRLGVAFAMLAAFGVPATLPIAGLIVVASGMSTLVPALRRRRDAAAADRGRTPQVATAASALSFSIGMQVGVTLVNTIVGVVAITLVFGTMRPAAIRASFASGSTAHALGEGRVQPVGSLGTCSDAGSAQPAASPGRVVPAPGVVSISSSPSTNATRSRHPGQPEAWRCRRRSEAGAVVAHDDDDARPALECSRSRAKLPSVRSHSRAPPARPGRSRPRSGA